MILNSKFLILNFAAVRPQLKNASNEIAAVGAPMSAIPDVSRFWTAATSNGTYLLTWESFAAGRVTTNEVERVGGGGRWNLTSAQIELRRDGDFITRSNDVESVWRRVIEPNPISPINPQDPDNPLMPIRPYGPVQDLSVIEKTNAYCWVDIVVHDADAWVRFEGDGPSNLADPSFAAKAGATNRVIILIGKTYKVTCDMPFSVTDKSDGEIEDWWDDDQALWLNWPVEVWAESDDAERPLLLLGARNGSGGRRSGFTMHVSPLGLGGSFAWTDGCCSISGSGSHFVFDCDEDCSCNGCYATGFFSYEGYHLPVEGDSCGCGVEEEDDDDTDDPYDPLLAVGVSASFSKRVIFLEDEYANTTNEVVPWHSEMTELSCVACGGMNGGHVSMTITGDSNLIRLGGQEMPFERDLEPYEVFSFTNTYKAVAESGRHEDIVATASFVENLTGWTETSIAKATAVRVEFKPEVNAPENFEDYRHIVGVCEWIECRQYPSAPRVSFVPLRGGNMITASCYECPSIACEFPLEVQCGSVQYVPAIQVLAPVEVEARDVDCVVQGVSVGDAGGIALTMDLYAKPLSVSFGRTAMEEVPNEGGGPAGYFENMHFSGEWHHNEDCGAGIWGNVDSNNMMLNDTAGFTNSLPRMTESGNITTNLACRWRDGTITWMVPCGWNVRDTTGPAQPVGQFAVGETQVMMISEQGSSGVRKHRQTVRRDVNGDVFLNGRKVR